MTTLIAFSLTVGYAAVCCFFSALLIGLWFGAYKFISEGFSSVKQRSKNNKFIKVASMITMVSFVVIVTSANVYFWSRLGTVFRELQCSCGQK